LKNKNISIVIVSWYSSTHILRLIKNLYINSKNKENIFFIIVDNTNGNDQKLSTDIKSVNNIYNIKLIYNSPNYNQRSVSHASGLDRAMNHINGYYTLIIDPDTYIFKKNWDLFCIKKLNDINIAIGAPYPLWKLGKVHDFPSPVFFFSKTNWILNENTTWYPFPNNYKRIFNFFTRKIVRLFGFSSRKRLSSSIILNNISKNLEKLFGISSPDTGNNFYIKSKKEKLNSIVFKSYNLIKNQKNLSEKIIKLSNEFELYFYDDVPFLTHQYSSNIFYYKIGSKDEDWTKYINEFVK